MLSSEKKIHHCSLISSLWLETNFSFPHFARFEWSTLSATEWTVSSSSRPRVTPICRGSCKSRRPWGRGTPRRRQHASKRQLWRWPRGLPGRRQANRPWHWPPHRLLPNSRRRLLHHRRRRSFCLLPHAPFLPLENSVLQNSSSPTLIPKRLCRSIKTI